MSMVEENEEASQHVMRIEMELNEERGNVRHNGRNLYNTMDNRGE